MLFRKKYNPVITNGTVYIVRGKKHRGGEYTASFKTRAEARIYKKLLRGSYQQVESEIYKHTYADGYEFTPEKVS